MLNYKQLPEGLRGGMQRYIEERIRPGHFLTAILENDLVEAFARVDKTNRDDMHRIVGFLYNELPMRSYDGSPWGSPEAVHDWLVGE